MPIILAAYDLSLLAFLPKMNPGIRGTPPIAFIAAQLPVMPPVLFLMPRVTNLVQSITGSVPRGSTEGAIFIGIPLACWVVYGIVIGALIDRTIANRKSGARSSGEE